MLHVKRCVLESRDQHRVVSLRDPAFTGFVVVQGRRSDGRIANVAAELADWVVALDRPMSEGLDHAPSKSLSGLFDIVGSQISVRGVSKLDRTVAPAAHQVAMDMPRFGFSTAEAIAHRELAAGNLIRKLNTVTHEARIPRRIDARSFDCLRATKFPTALRPFAAVNEEHSDLPIRTHDIVGTFGRSLASFASAGAIIAASAGKVTEGRERHSRSTGFGGRAP